MTEAGRAEVHADVLRCTLEHRLSFEELRDLLAYQWRDRPASRCKGLVRAQVHGQASAALSRHGRRAIAEARQARENDGIPEHVLGFIAAQLRLLYPGLDPDEPAEDKDGA